MERVIRRDQYGGSAQLGSASLLLYVSLSHTIRHTPHTQLDTNHTHTIRHTSHTRTIRHTPHTHIYVCRTPLHEWSASRRGHNLHNKQQTIIYAVWRERKPTSCNNQMFIINFCLNMFQASLCPSSGEQRMCVTAYDVLHCNKQGNVDIRRNVFFVR